MLDRIFLEPMARLASELVLLIMALVVIGVGAGVMRVDPLLEFGRSVPLLGEALTQNSIMDAQWHLYAALVLLALPALTARNGNVRVDFINERFGPRARAWIDLLGHTIFALPFLILILPATWRFAAAAQRTAERSLDGGLTDRYLIKALIVIGMALLLLVVLRDLWRCARRALGFQQPSPP